MLSPRAGIVLIALLLLVARTTMAAPPQPAALATWADASLPVQSGLVLWLDATRQPAAWAANKKQELVDGDAIDIWYDASSSRRDFQQTSRDAQPKFLGGETAAAVRFDGTQDHLLWSGDSKPLDSFTAIILAAPRSNEGDFRALLAARQTGKNDYNTGFNIDLGPHPAGGDGYNQLSVEGPGFIGQANLLKTLLPFDKLQTFTITAASGKEGVKAYTNGKLTGQRDRGGDASLATSSLTLGARCYSNEDAPPYVSGFLEGDIAEVIVYDRVLSDDERTAIESYLTKKHAKTQPILAAAEQTGQPLKRIENPPEIQMFVPGFTWRRLPLDLTNINNVRYREDGKAVALAYDGNIYLLSDTDKDGLEDKATLFWESKGNLVAPIGMALTPPGYKHGRGLFVAAKGKVCLIVDTDNDDKADKEIVLASGWPGTFHQVDALGVAYAADGSIYFGLGTSNFANPFLTDKAGKSGYDVKGERGTIMRIAPDFSKREIISTGIRFPVGMAFNSLGDLFVTDQEGATWMANGNPFDELLHIERGRHYGFPPRHPVYLPDAIDEPSVFDYAPQHQSTCGLLFNDAAGNGPIFGPESWRGDAIVCGESRGKLYRTQLAKTSTGYVARNHLIASMPLLLIDSALAPTGDLLLATHSGNPDWGTGPTGHGKLYKITYSNREAPQPLLCYPTSAGEIQLVFDRPLDAAFLEGISKRLSIEYGAYVGAGDRFEKIYPGYAAVKRQMRAPRHPLSISGIQVSPDRRTLIVHPPPQAQALAHALTCDTIDLGYDLTGAVATWQPTDNSAPSTLWLPHPDPAVSRAFTTGSADHDRFYQSLKSRGKLTLQTQLDLKDMLRPAVQPGSKLDYTLPPETVTITFESNSPLDLQSPGLSPSITTQGQTIRASITVAPKPNELTPIRLTLSSASADPQLRVWFSTNEDPRPRALPLRRFLLPWAKLPSSTESETKLDIPELAGGDWLRGRDLFYGNQAACSMCHSVRGEGSDVGPDLSNLIHRDYESVLRDLRDPSGALNPEYIASIVKLKDGRILSGIVRNTDADHFRVRGDAAGEKVPIARSAVASIRPSPLSLMPKGLPEGLGPEKVRDLLTFLLTEPLSPAPLLHDGPPPPRTRAEVEAVLKSTTRPTAPFKPLNVLLVSGPKDHGPGEHDYPLFQQRWSKLLSLAPNVTVTQAENWPTPEQWQRASTAIFYSNNPAWTADKAKELDAFLARGGGLIYIHYAVDGHEAPDVLAQRIGLAWRGGKSKFRHGQLDMTIRDANHPITRGLGPSLKLLDESYWQLLGDPSRIHLLADGPEEGAPRPLMWTMENPDSKGRVFVSIPGHFTWTFDDPVFRLVLLRAIAWTAGEPTERLSDLATIGARIQN